MEIKIKENHYLNLTVTTLGKVWSVTNQEPKENARQVWTGLSILLNLFGFHICQQKIINFLLLDVLKKGNGKKNKTRYK